MAAAPHSHSMGILNVRTRPLVAAAFVLPLVVLLGFLFLHVCADGGAMASAYRTCHCRGTEWELYDRTPADGPRRTVCLGSFAPGRATSSGPDLKCHVHSE